MHGCIRIEASGKVGGVEGQLPAIGSYPSALGKIGAPAGVACRETDDEVWSDLVIDAQRESGAREIVTRGVARIAHICPFAIARYEDSPSIVRTRSEHHLFVALALGSLRPFQLARDAKRAAIALGAAVHRQARRAESIGARADIIEAALQIEGLHLGLGDRDLVDGG